MKLGIHIPLEFFTPNQAVQAAQVVEAAGLDHVVVNDHLRLPEGPHINEAWTVLASMGAVTDRIRLGPCVTPLPLRHPYLLAKMATTLDHLTGGRLILGVGAGWHREEFEWAGVPFLPHSKRLAQTEEAIQLLRSYWTEAVTTFQGDYYQIQDAVLEPKPIQAPYPPFFLGGGSINVLDLIARYGHGWMPFSPTVSGLRQRLDQLDAMLVNYGRKLEDLEIIPNILLQFGHSKQEARQGLPKWGTPLSENRVILGTPADCLKRIHEYVDAGATHLALRLVQPDEIKQAITLITQEIVPNL